MKMSETINELAAALSKAQKAMKLAPKDKENQFFKSNYTDLGTVIDTARDPLGDNGLAVSQVIEQTDDGSVLLETILMHSSGQWISSTLKMRPVKNDPQGMGSAITYARRYSYAAIIGLASEEDDDGAAASQKTRTAPAAQSQPAKTKTQPITEFQMKKIFALGSSLGKEAEQVKAFAKKMARVEHMAEITLEQANKIIDVLEAKLKGATA